MAMIRVSITDRQMAHLERLADCAQAGIEDVVKALIDLDMKGTPPAQPVSLSKLNDMDLVVRILMETGGNVSETARQLGINRRTLQRKMVRYGLLREDFI